MYRCKSCKKQTPPRMVKCTLVAGRRLMEYDLHRDPPDIRKGWEITRTVDVCPDCYNKVMNKI